MRLNIVTNTTFVGVGWGAELPAPSTMFVAEKCVILVGKYVHSSRRETNVIYIL